VACQCCKLAPQFLVRLKQQYAFLVISVTFYGETSHISQVMLTLPELHIKQNIFRGLADLAGSLVAATVAFLS
jgi:hypothetical protein